MSDRHPWSSTPEDLELPSGLTAKVKPVRVQTLIRVGALDGELLDTLENESEDATANMRLMAEVAVRALVEPKATFDARKVNEAKGIYHVDTIPDEDLTAIFAWTRGADLEAFRGDRAGARTGADSAVVAGEAE